MNFVSTTQYYLGTSGGNGVTISVSPTSDNWFDSGSSATATSNYVWNSVGGQSRNNLYRWNLDGGSWNNIARANAGTYTTSSIVMSTYHTVNFGDTVQYCLTVTGGNGVTYGALSPTSDNWYDAGASTTVSSDWVWSTVPSVSRTVITNYAIDGANQNPARQDTGTLTTSSLSMSTYHTIAFATITQYYLTNTLIAGSVNSITASPTSDSWYDSGTSVNVVLNYVWGASSSTRSSLFSYTVDATTTNVVRSGSGTFAVPVIAMNVAHSISDGARTQYFLTNTLIAGSVNSITASPTVIAGMILARALTWF